LGVGSDWAQRDTLKQTLATVEIRHPRWVPGDTCVQ
jgi:hypothetical protein